MAGETDVQVSHFLDEYGLSAFHIKLLIWSALIAMVDGYDIGAIAFAAPHLLADWKVQMPDLKWVLAGSNVGVLFGSQIFGWLGDRYGRRVALISGCIFFGVFTFIASYATNLTEMFWLRVIAGLGIGGVIPNVVAINVESAPRHLRATLAIIAVGLVPLGGALAGFASPLLVTDHHWQILFQIGGIVPIVIGLAAIFGLPESIKYMALHETHRRKMEQLVAAIRPGFKVPPNARFVIEDEKQFPSSNPRYLFENGLGAITPLTWLLFAFNLMGYFFLISWTPTRIAASTSHEVAALAGAALQVGGTVGALTLCWWLQRQRFLAIAIMFVIAVPIVASIGYAQALSTTALLTATFFAGFIVLGIQSGINVVGAMIYPTSLRANGSGWQLGLGRLGAIIGPYAGAMLVPLPLGPLYVWSALPFAVGAVVCFTIYVLNKARLRADPELAQAQ